MELIMENTMKRFALVALLMFILSPGLASAVGVGSPVPSVSVSTLSNPATKVNLAGLGAKYVLIDFWASWCVSCRVSMSELTRLSKALAPKGFKVVGVCLDKDPAGCSQFLKKYPAGFLQLSDPQSVSAGRFGLPKMPTSYLVGPDKKIIKVFPGYSAGNESIIKALVK